MKTKPENKVRTRIKVDAQVAGLMKATAKSMGLSVGQLLSELAKADNGFNFFCRKGVTNRR